MVLCTRTLLTQAATSWQGSLLFALVNIAYALFLGFDIRIGKQESAALWLTNICLTVLFGLEILVWTYRAGRVVKSPHWQFCAALTAVNVVDVVLALASAQPHVRKPFRVLRLLRVPRLIFFMQHLPWFPSVISLLPCVVRTVIPTVLLLALLCYVGSVFCVAILGASVACDSVSGHCTQDYFSSVGLGVLTHLQVALVQGWPAIAGALMASSWWWCLYLIAFVLITHLAVLSLLFAVLIELTRSFHQTRSTTAEEEKLRQLQEASLRALFRAACQDKAEALLSVGQCLELLSSPEAAPILHQTDVGVPYDPQQLAAFFGEPSHESSVSEDEWMLGLSRMRGTHGSALSRSLHEDLLASSRHIFDKVASADATVKAAMKAAVSRTGWQLLFGLGRLGADLQEHTVCRPGPVSTKAKGREAPAQVQGAIAEIESQLLQLQKSAEVSCPAKKCKDPEPVRASANKVSRTIQTRCSLLGINSAVPVEEPERPFVKVLQRARTLQDQSWLASKSHL